MTTATMKTMELTFTRTIPASPADVFEAWMDPKHPGHPWTDSKKLIYDGRVDGLFYFVNVKAGGGVEWPHYGRFIAIQPDKRVQYGWMSPFTEGNESIVTVTFEKKGDDTLLTLTHANLPDNDNGRAHKGGWNSILDRMFVDLPRKR